eukprot:TRINITY_DN25744_c0_g1_i1.p1 TRINITY_DN25744_c0_g1~~TRINITY_DN25744_c0_g1_i1.p1  ORF type:complete len:184 (+),score=32.71 TRINITY_DN25744_c0_g1_i1:33-554(+)
MSVSDAPPSTVVFTKPLDVVQYLKGTWKRCMEEKDFGGCFQFRRTNNIVIVISAEVSEDAGVEVLRWDIAHPGKKDELTHMYNMTIKTITDKEAAISYTYQDMPCQGRFISGPNALLLTHIDSAQCTAVVSITYRILDDNTMAVVVAECDSKGPSRLLTGIMHRVEIADYPQT